MPFPTHPGSTRLPIHVEASPWGAGAGPPISRSFWSPLELQVVCPGVRSPLRGSRDAGGPSPPPWLTPFGTGRVGRGLGSGWLCPECPPAQPASPPGRASGGFCRGGVPGSPERRLGVACGQAEPSPAQTLSGGLSSAPGVAAGSPRSPLPTSPQGGARSPPHAAPQTGPSPHPTLVRVQGSWGRGSARRKRRRVDLGSPPSPKFKVIPPDRLDHVPVPRPGELCAAQRLGGRPPRAHTCVGFMKASLKDAKAGLPLPRPEP